MAKGYTTRKLQVHGLHVTSSAGSVSYPKLFAKIGRARETTRQVEDGPNAIALPVFRIQDEHIAFVAYKGPIGQFPLIFSRRSSAERLESLASDEIVATKTHGIIDIERREAIIEYNHSGAKATDIAYILQHVADRVGRADWYQFEINPKADQSFLDDLARFRTVKVATVKMAQPNPGWSDYESHFTAVAEESNARVIEVSVSAGRGRSVNQRAGLIEFLKRIVSGGGVSPLKGAHVSGYREGETSATTISLANHVEHQRIEVRMTPEGHVDTRDIQRKLKTYLDARRGSEGT